MTKSSHPFVVGLVSLSPPIYPCTLAHTLRTPALFAVRIVMSLSLGIELEAVVTALKGCEAIPFGIPDQLDLIRDAFDDAGLDARVFIPDPITPAMPDYSRWTVTTDSSVRVATPGSDSSESADWSRFSFELVSPVLDENSEGEWQEQMRRGFAAIDRRFDWKCNRSTGLHVHIGRHDEGFTLPELKRLAILVIRFEGASQFRTVIVVFLKGLAPQKRWTAFVHLIGFQETRVSGPTVITARSVASRYRRRMPASGMPLTSEAYWLWSTTSRAKMMLQVVMMGVKHHGCFESIISLHVVLVAADSNSSSGQFHSPGKASHRGVPSARGHGCGGDDDRMGRVPPSLRSFCVGDHRCPRDGRRRVH